MAHKPEVYISVDIEASGPIPGEFSMLSLGACVVGLPSKTFYVELKPINDHVIDQALQVSGLQLADLKTKGEEPTQAMARFERWIKHISGESRPVFVAFNATFDWMFTHARNFSLPRNTPTMLLTMPQNRQRFLKKCCCLTVSQSSLLL